MSLPPDVVSAVRSRIAALNKKIESQGLSGLEAAEYIRLLRTKPKSADPGVQLAFGPGHRIVEPVPYEQVVAEMEAARSGQPDELEARRIAAARNYDAILWNPSSSAREIEDARFALSHAEARVYEFELNTSQDIQPPMPVTIEPADNRDARKRGRPQKPADAKRASDAARQRRCRAAKRAAVVTV